MNISLHLYAGEIRGRVSRVGRQWGEEAIHTLLTLEVGYITKHQHPIAGWWVHYRPPLPYDEVRSPLNVVLDDLPTSHHFLPSPQHLIKGEQSSPVGDGMQARRGSGATIGEQSQPGGKKEALFLSPTRNKRTSQIDLASCPRTGNIKAIAFSYTIIVGCDGTAVSTRAVKWTPVVDG